MPGGILANWNGFVGIVLALSGVKAIANATGVMKLDPGSTDDHPTVSKTSTPAILWVMPEVCLFTALLGLGMHALNSLQIHNGDVDAPGNPGVRDYMLRYMAEALSLFVDKPNARLFAATILVFGLILRGLVTERAQKKAMRDGLANGERKAEVAL